MKKDYVNIGMVEYGTEVLLHTGGSFEDENMVECEFMHNIGHITTVRVKSTGKQAVKCHTEFYTKKPKPKPKVGYEPDGAYEYISMTKPTTSHKGVFIDLTFGNNNVPTVTKVYY